MVYVYFYKSIFQNKSIHIIFTFSNSTTWELFMIYIFKIGLKPCPKRQVFWVWREYVSFTAEDEQVLVTEEDFPEVRVGFQVIYSLFPTILLSPFAATYVTDWVC